MKSPTCTIMYEFYPPSEKVDYRISFIWHVVNPFKFIYTHFYTHLHSFTLIYTHLHSFTLIFIFIFIFSLIRVKIAKKSTFYEIPKWVNKHVENQRNALLPAHKATFVTPLSQYDQYTHHNTHQKEKNDSLKTHTHTKPTTERAKSWTPWPTSSPSALAPPVA